jgi:hypothetical protein
VCTSASNAGCIDSHRWYMAMHSVRSASAALLASLNGLANGEPLRRYPLHSSAAVDRAVRRAIREVAHVQNSGHPSSIR